MKRLLFLVAAVVATQAFAQSPTPDSRKRLVFPPGASEPLPTPAPTPTPAPVSASTESGPAAKPNGAAETIDAFFLALKADKVDAAYDALVKGTIIADRAQDVASLKERTKHALDSYGPISGYEVVDEQIVGTVLFRRTCLSFNTDLPLRWRFYFYKSGGNWNLVDLRVDDGLVELFEDAARRR